MGQRVMRTQRRVPLLVNIRTHNAAVPGLPIMVGSMNGHALARMNQRCPGNGDVRFREQGGLITRLVGRGWLVQPARQEAPDPKEYQGGEVLRTCALEAGTWCMDAVEITVPGHLCDPNGLGLRPLSKDLAFSLAHMYNEFTHYALLPPE